METQLFDFFNLTRTESSAAIIIFNILLSFALQLVILWVYKKTHKGLSYSQSFLFTLVIIGVLGSVIMMVVQNNLIGAFALLGAFSLIRFRTIVKETRDVAFVFFALAIGVAVGTSNYSIALIATIMLSGIILVMSKYSLGITNGSNTIGYVLTLSTSGELDMEKLKKLLSLHSQKPDLLHAKYREGRGGHYAFSINVEDEKDLHTLESELKGMNKIDRFEFITSKHSVEY
ncbi:MAG: hypothetical protein ACI9VM_000015 [Candidatus Azotimanducaceae bacterium]|jgi:hypothetical protein